MAVILAFAENTIVLMLVSFAVATILLQAAANGPFWPWSVELFPTRLRATGQGVASAAGKVGGFIGTAAFPTVLASLHWHLSMLMFAVLFVLGILIIAFLGQETRGMSLARLDDNRNENVATRQGGDEHHAQ
jgi:MFS family permease